MAYGGSLKTDFMSDETFELLCMVCTQKGKNAEAEKYCIECKEYFCLSCVKVHAVIPALTGHMILDKDQFPSGTSRRQSRRQPGSSQGQLPAPTERCDKHSHYFIDMYCQNHDNVGCATCMATDHKLCMDTFYIPEYLKKSTTASKHSNVQDKLDSVTKSLKESRNKLHQEKVRLLQQKFELLEKIRKFRKEITARLDDLEKISTDEVERKYKIMINKLEDKMKMLDSNKCEVKAVQDKVASTGGNVSQNFVNAKRAEIIASKATRCVDASKTHANIDDISFSPEQRILVLLQEISMLGTITQSVKENTEVKSSDRGQSHFKMNQAKPSAGHSQRVDVLLQAKGSSNTMLK